MKFRQQKGFTLLEIVIALAVGALVLVFSVQLYAFVSRYIASTQDRFTLRSITRTIQDGVSCESLQKTCRIGAGFPLYNRRGAVIVEAAGSKMRGFTVRAVCTGEKAFTVSALKLDARGRAMKDSLTGRENAWGSDSVAIFNEASLCPTSTGDESDEDSRLEIISGAPCFVQSKLSRCEPEWPRFCPRNFVNNGVSLDTFGGESEKRADPIFGRRYVRYCIQQL